MRFVHSFLGVFFLAAIGSATTLAAESTNQWYLRGPAGGYAYQVGIDSVSQRPLTGGIAGVFRYDALATAWDYTNTGAPTPFVGGMATTATATFINSGGYVARSTDGGVTWTNVSDIGMGGNVSAIATSPNAPSRVYVSANPGGLFRSDNLGASWALNPNTPPDATLAFVRASPTNANLIFVAGLPQSNGTTELYRSDDGGVSFTGPVCTTLGSQSIPEQFFDIAQDASNPGTLFAISGAVPGLLHTALDAGGEVWVSTDAGLTWGSANVNQFLIAPETSGGGEPRALLVDRFTPNTVYVATTWGVYKVVTGNGGPVLSSSGMLQMGPRNSGAQPFDEVDGLTQANDGTLYAATTSGGVYKSTNSALSWTAINTGYTGLDARIFAFQPGNTGVVLAGSADPSNTGSIFRSVDNGMTWVRSSSGMNAGALRGLAFSPSNPNVVIAAGFKQGDVGGEQTRCLWRSADAGQTWTRIDDAGLRFNPKRIVLFDPNDSNRVMAASPTYLNLSTDGGVHWSNSFDSPASFVGLPFVNNPSLTLLGLAAGPKSGGGTRFYASVSNNLVQGSPLPAACQGDTSLPCKGGVYYSDDGGASWSHGTGITDDTSAYLSISPTPGTVFVGQIKTTGYAGGIFKSTDYGVTWTDSSNGLPCRNIFSSIATDPTDAQVAWTACNFTDVAHPGGIFRTNDAGATWVPYGRGLRNPSIVWMTIDPADHNHLLAGGNEGIHEMHFAPDADQDGIPDSDEAQFAGGDANNDGTQDATQSFVASTGTTGATFTPTRADAATTAGDYVVVEVENAAPIDNGQCQFVSDLVVVPSDQIPPSNRMIQAAPTVRFILPDCEQATVKIRYSAVASYPVGVFGSYSPAIPGDAASIRWGLLSQAAASQSAGTWTLHLDQNLYGNVYAPNSGSISFQGAPGKDSIFGNGFD